MNESLIPIIVDLMKKVVETCTQILIIANNELLSAREKKEKIKFVEYTYEVTTLEQLIEIAEAVIHDVQKKEVIKSPSPLLKITAGNVARMLHLVATRRSLHKIIITGFKEANVIINTKF